MRKGKNYPIFPNGGYGLGCPSDYVPPRRLIITPNFFYNGVFQGGGDYTQPSDECRYFSVGPAVASILWVLNPGGFLAQIEMVTDTTPSRIYSLYFDVADPFGNRLSQVWEFPNPAWFFPQGGNPQPTFVQAQLDAPFSNLGNATCRCVLYGELPPPWPT